MSTEFVLHKPNFLGIPAEFSSPERSRFVVLPVPYEKTTSYMKGTRLGPQYLINASHQVELYDEEIGTETWKAGVHTMPPVPLEEDPARYFAAVGNAVEPVVRMGKFLMAVGGEHAITEGPLSGVVRVHPRISVFHVDAHCDLRDEFEGTKYNHACAARRMMEYADKIVQVGIRSVSEDEKHHTNTKKVRTFLMHQTRDIKALIPQVLAELTDTVYISIDLDGLDPAVVPGVGTPQPGGLGWYDLLDLLREIIAKKNVVAADVVELCPIEGQVISEFAAAKLVYRIMGYVHQKDMSAETKVRSKSAAPGMNHGKKAKGAKAKS